MRKLFFGILVVCMSSGCGQSSSQSHGCNMTYNCNGNVSCVNSMHVTGGSGSFQNETDCLAWETGFLNSYGLPRVSATSCTCY